MGMQHMPQVALPQPIVQETKAEEEVEYVFLIFISSSGLRLMDGAHV